ncbi:hypothetical protein D6D13_10642 [Aureobasidium pullulans]|uniref:Uncharacterized protein n=1 Tax=Aureobasidium pullulans TaxID=5580 RepID=A0A4S9BX50_AURPU|nr:hypothetical protein D6D13_10642 [Aureobasidium pullulans]
MCLMIDLTMSNLDLTRFKRESVAPLREEEARYKGVSKTIAFLIPCPRLSRSNPLVFNLSSPSRSRSPSPNFPPSYAVGTVKVL